jgi:hypothetical protein
MKKKGQAKKAQPMRLDEGIEEEEEEEEPTPTRKNSLIQVAVGKIIVYRY